MQLKNVKPHLDKMIHFFDHQHQFFMKAEVHFNHHDQQLRAILLFPFKQKGQFILDKIDVFYNNQWVMKRGNPNLYGMTLTNHNSIIWLSQHVYTIETEAKLRLENHFQKFVQTLADRIEAEISLFYPIQCEVAHDSLSILTIFNLNGEEYEGVIETNNYFESIMDEVETINQLLSNYTSQILNNIEKIKIVQAEHGDGSRKTYITTIPITNPVETEGYQDQLLINVYAKGFCDYCQQHVYQSIKSNVKINPSELEKQQLDLLITVLGDQFICEHCHNIVDKEKIVMKNAITEKIFAERFKEELDLLGNTHDQDFYKKLVLEAVEHKHYFHEHQEVFWKTYSFIASQQWESFISELTKNELEYVLTQFLSALPARATKEELLYQVHKLNLIESQKGVFWRKANELLIDYYLNITIFGWNIKKEREIIGEKRANFIFQYLPIPESLKKIHQKRIDVRSKSAESNLISVENEKLRQHIQLLQQENGRLSQKLGEANRSITNLEQATFNETIERNPTDILKIQQLKGLIEELKAEITLLASKLEPEINEQPESVTLTEEKPQQIRDVSEVDLLSGKKIFIIGGFRPKQMTEDVDYTVWTHEARHLDPDFYYHLNEADILIVLTRYISHHAMWEAKEFAILEQKPIFYSPFTNIPTILQEVKEKL